MTGEGVREVGLRARRVMEAQEVPRFRVHA